MYFVAEPDSFQHLRFIVVLIFLFTVLWAHILYMQGRYSYMNITYTLEYLQIDLS